MSKKHKPSKKGGWFVLAFFGLIFVFLGYRMVHQAYWDIKVESPDWKTRFQEDFPGMEKAASLAPEKRKRVIEQSNKEFCPCKCGYTLAGCLKDDRNCPIRPKNLDRIGELVRQAQNLPGP